MDTARLPAASHSSVGDQRGGARVGRAPDLERASAEPDPAHKQRHPTSAVPVQNSTHLLTTHAAKDTKLNPRRRDRQPNTHRRGGGGGGGGEVIFTPPVISRTKGRSGTREAAIESSCQGDSNKYDMVLGFRTVNSSGPKIAINAPKLKEKNLYRLHAYSTGQGHEEPNSTSQGQAGVTKGYDVLSAYEYCVTHVSGKLEA